MFVPLVLAVDFANFTYATNPCRENVPVPVVMKRSSFSYFDQKMGAGFELFVKRVVRGSLAPATRQAVVVISCDFPVGGVAAAYLYDEQKTSARLLAQVGDAAWGPDWGAGSDSIHVRFRSNFLYVDQCENNQCPARVVTTYALRKGKLVEVYQTKRN